MTNHWIDVKNAKTILVLGANPVENHPAVTQYINEAVTSGAQLLVADPRKTRTANMCSAGGYLRMRPGTNGALIMGLMNYAIQNNRYNGDALTGTVNTRTFLDSTNAAVYVSNWPKWSDATFELNSTTNPTDYVRENVATTGSTISGLPKRIGLNDPTSVWTYLKNQAAVYTPTVVADICDIPGGANAFSAWADKVTNTAKNGPANAGTILYAMGATQSSHAGQDLRGYSMYQTIMGNMGVPGGGVNAMRGIHNVQGSTDQGLLFGAFGIPGYSHQPTGTAKSYQVYQNQLFGNQQANTAATGEHWAGLQQRGFRNMMWHWFRQGDRTVNANDPASDEYSFGAGSKNFDLVPKDNGLNHYQMFQSVLGSGGVASKKVNCLVVLGQNPAVTEPNSTLVKRALYNLDTLVCVDIFENETAAVDRKSTGVTYLLPSASFVEEEGSITNSGRWIQWRNKAIDPRGNSKTDTEILLRLAKALDTAGAFNHVPLNGYSDRYTQLYDSQYGWAPASGAMTGTTIGTVAENVFKQMASRNTMSGEYGALWIYGHASAAAWDPFQVAGSGTSNWWSAPNLAKSRNTNDNGSTKGLYNRWGFAWLSNRRIFYNNTTSFGDAVDAFVTPDKVARLFCHNSASGAPPAIADYSNTYRTYSKITGTAVPKHYEPVETIRTDLRSTYGTNASPTTEGTVADVSGYPFTLTTFRTTEHFQGGPMTRNLTWLAEITPAAVIEVNSADAYAKGITNGANVYIDTPRATGIGPFIAVVGSGSGANQRVKKGVVAVPWHWGNKGIVTGPTANDVCIDSFDPDAKIPESKACLCNIHL